MDATLETLAAEKYVLVTTYRKSGEGVATPVWIAAIDDTTLGFTTSLSSGKAKRLRNNSRVTVQPCDVRGTLVEGSAPVEMVGHTVAEGPERDAAREAVKRKYGWQFRLINVAFALGNLFRRSRGTEPYGAMILRLPS